MRTLLTTDDSGREILINEDKIIAIQNYNNKCRIHFNGNFIDVNEDFNNLLKFYHEEE